MGKHETERFDEIDGTQIELAALDEPVSRLVTCDQEQAMQLVRDLIEKRKRGLREYKAGSRIPKGILTIVIDGLEVPPQVNISMAVAKRAAKGDEFSVKFAQHDAGVAIYAGVAMAILERLLAVCAKRTKKRPAYETTWPEKVLRVTARYPDYDADKVPGLIGHALSYLEKAVATSHFERATVVLLNSDKLHHEPFGRKFNDEVAQSLLFYGGDTINVLMFRSPESEEEEK